MEKHMLAVLLFLVLMATPLSAQTERAWEPLIEQLAALEDIETAEWENAYDLFSELESHPQDINTVTREDLEQLMFLSNQQIEDVCQYLYRYAPLRSMGEIHMIESLDPLRLQLMRCFFYAGEEAEKGFPNWKTIAKHGKSDILATAKIPTYERQGDREGYLGYPYRHSVRYTFSYGNWVKAGLIGAQDSGEPFLSNRNKTGYDYYSAYLMLKKMGRIKTLALGRYRLRTGLGLVINNDFAPGKTATLSMLNQNRNTIRAHSSHMENYLQGAAATVAATKSIDVTAFLSYRAIDATLTPDSNAIRTIIDNGYHRTQTEMDKKHNAHQWLTGANINWKGNNGLHAGMTAIATGLSHELQPRNGQIYRQYYASGQTFWNISADYGYNSRRLTLSGETATGGCGALATINTLSVSVTDEVDLVGLWRFYSYRYYSLFSRSFSEGGSVQNENGVYGGVNWHPSRHFSFTAYTDYAYFAWPRYSTEANSHSWDNMVNAVWQKHHWTVATRYRLRLRSQDTQHRARFSVARNHEQWSTKLQADFSAAEGKTGWMGSISGGLRSKAWQLYATAGYFHTDDYNTRIYLYEQGMLYSFGFPSYYGEGIRYALMARATLSPQLQLNAKVGTTNYFDRNVIGSGLQQINHSSMTDVEIQIKWKL